MKGRKDCWACFNYFMSSISPLFHESAQAGREHFSRLMLNLPLSLITLGQQFSVS